MPHLNNDVLDDPILADGQVSFSGGMSSVAKPSLINGDQSQELKNVVLDRNGRANSRPGFHHIHFITGALDGGAYYDTPSVEQLVVAADGALAHLVPSGDQDTDVYTETAISGYTYTEGNQVQMAQLVDKLYLADGSQRLYEWDGSTLRQVVTGSGTNSTNPLAAGAKYICTHTWRLFAAGIASTPDTVYASDFLDGSEWAAASFRVGAGEGQAITALHPWHAYYLAVFKSASVYVVDCTPVTTAGVVTDPAGTLQTAMFPIQVVNSRVGCVAHRTVAQVGFDLFFLSQDGVRSLQRSAQEQQFGVSDPLSAPIQDYIDRINWNAIDTACATFYKSRYIISLPLDSDTRPKHTFSYNTLTQSWEGYWTADGPQQWITSRFSDKERLQFLTSSGHISRWREYVEVGDRSSDDYQDDPNSGSGTFTRAAFETVVHSKAFNFGEVLNDKTGFTAEVEFADTGVGSTISIAVARDSESPVTLATETVASQGITLPTTLPVVFPSQRFRRLTLDLMSQGPFRELSTKVTATSGPLFLRVISVTAFPDTMNTRYGLS